MSDYAHGDVLPHGVLDGLLDDPATGPCGMCDICAGIACFDAPLDPADVEGAAHSSGDDRSRSSRAGSGR